MSRAFKRLERVLKLEANQGYQNKAVVGGIRQFATFWVGQAREEAVDEIDRALVEQTAELLLTYGRLSGVEKRAEALDTLLRQLAAREARVKGLTGGAAPPPRPKQATRSEPRREDAGRSRRSEPRRSRATAPGRRYAEIDDTPASDERDEEPDRPVAVPPGEITLREAAEPDPQGLAQPVTAINGVGPQIAGKLANLNVATVGDLLRTYPRRYDDYTQMKPIHRLVPGEQVTLIGTVWQVQARRKKGNQQVIQAVVSDGSGSITIYWYNQRWLINRLSAGMQIAVSGKVDQFLGRPVMHAPEWEPVSEELLVTGRIAPIYPLTEGLGAHKMRGIMARTVRQWSARVPEPLPESVRDNQKLLAIHDALYQIHLPESQAALHMARERLVFEELFYLTLAMLGQRHEWQGQPARPVDPGAPLRREFVASLPYTLTAAQQRVVDELAADMARNRPMTRLLQGDVGSGKTVVAAAAMALAVAVGGQAALMAPTEILAEQHYDRLAALLSPLGVTVRLLTGSTSAGARQDVYDELTSGRAQIAIGTHALIQEAVTFHDLVLAVIDEQHRFGVDQRRALRERNRSANAPHLLAMSATPIPRTLAMSLYGDLDLSVLDEMPPGRQEIETRWIRPEERERAYAFVRGQVNAGRQAYVICPLVEESDKIEARSAVEEHARLQKEVFPDHTLGLVHGRLSSSEKESAMRAFYEGAVDILVSTSVIEVGVDVANATVMLIEGANRFGLAQLHQFRGRVGRGEHQSYCLLVADSTSADAEERLAALEQTNDGFLLAEKDLDLRGPGQFFGKRQSGLPELRLASLLDAAMLERARDEANRLFAIDPALQAPEHALLREQVAQFWPAAADGS